MSATPELKRIATQTCGRLFEYYADFLIAGTYYRGQAGSAAVQFLVAPVPASLLVAGLVNPNDEQILFSASDVADLSGLRPGDYLVETNNYLRRDVIAAHLDLTKTMWTIIGRRVFA